MSGTFGSYVQGYMDFATENGTASGGGTWVLVAGPIVVALLGLYSVYNVVAVALSGAARTARFAFGLVSRPAEAAPVPVALAAAIAAPMPRIRIEPSVRSHEVVLVSSAA